MSLLLDALKKAAEQKAEKSRQEVEGAKSSDETIIEATPDDISELAAAADSALRQSRPAQEDETQLDSSKFETRLDPADVEPKDGTETRLEIHDTTETQSSSSQMQTGEDETIIFAEDDVADFMGEPELIQRPPRAPEDETDLSQLAPHEDQTGVGERAAPVAKDETDLSQLAPREDETDVSELAARSGGEETDLSQLAPREDETDVSELARRSGSEETDLSQLAPREDETELQGQSSAEDRTDVSLPPASVADLEYQAAQRAAAEETDLSQFVEPAADSADEDMSLLLVERDQTNLTSPTLRGDDSQQPDDQAAAENMDSGDDEELGLVDTTRHRLPPDTAAASVTQTSVTATTGIRQDTQTTRTEATSTRTYAPDNYDRTLMRLPSDDASKLFAGMKSDADVVMTPEYAKKVFHSKSSAQRLQHYKIYGGIALTIFLAIFVYGLFEYQDQSGTIDNSLRALKRDPMPGAVKPIADQQSASLFPGAGVDVRTIDIIENADTMAANPIADTGVVADEATSDAAVAETDTEAPIEMASEAEIDVEPDSGMAMAEMPAETAAASVALNQGDASSPAQVAIADQAAPAAKPAAGSSSTLEISSDQQVAQKDLWLREAYAAYKAGNDELALDLYNQVLNADPGNRNALLARAAIHVQNGNSSAAIRDYQAILLANPKDSLAMASLLAVANFSPRETETQLKLMIRDEPDSPYLNFALANAYGAQNRWQEAQGYYFRALQGNPGDPNYAYNLAVSLEHIAQPRAAVTYYQRALDNFNNGLATFNREVVDQRLEKLGKL